MEEQAAAKDTKSGRFVRLLKSVLVLDAILLLFLTFGFVLPSPPVRDPQTGGLPSDMYDDSAKISPFAVPAAEPPARKVDIPVLTARGEHPTFVPAAATDIENSGAVFEDSDLRVAPANSADTSIAARPVVQPITVLDSSDAAPARVESVASPHTS